VHRNRVLEITELPETLRTSKKGSAEVVQTGGLMRVAMRSQVNSIPVP
jgi:hypothetical protein